MKLLDEIKKVSYLEGDFKLSSGKVSNYYFDKYKFILNPALLNAVIDSLINLIPKETRRIAGGELGGALIAVALSLKTGMPSIVVRKKSKMYGTENVIEGELNKDDNIILIEDVFTTGRQAIEFANSIRERGGLVLKILCVIDREEGARENIFDADFSCEMLFKKSDF